MTSAGESEDRRLVAAFLSSRSEAAFRALYRAHADAVFRVACRLADGREADAREIAQETWVRAIEALPRFAGRSALRSWLIGIAINCSRELFRRESRLTELPESSGKSTPPLDVRPQDALDLHAAVAQLPVGYREVLILHDVEGYTHREIGAMLGIHGGTSKSQLFQARRAVRALLESPTDQMTAEKKR